MAASPKRQALGKGLGALIPPKRADEGGGEGVRRGVMTVAIEEIRPNRFQPRKTFEDSALEELTESIREHGLMQPVLVRRHGSGYEIIAGERRWRACQMAGLKSIEVIVKDLADSQSFEWALIENIQREDLNPIEEAEAYRRLLDAGSLTQEQLAQRVSKDRSTIANALRLLKLPNEVRRQVVAGALSMGHARAILALDDEETMVKMAREVVKKGLSVREVERRVRALRAPSTRETVDPYAEIPGGEPAVKRTQEELVRSLATKVRIVPKGARGKIEIDYASFDELNRLVDLLKH